MDENIKKICDLLLEESRALINKESPTYEDVENSTYLLKIRKELILTFRNNS